MVCPNCGTPLPEDARFCPNCGTPVAAPSVQERKLVTVVFADLAGSTEQENLHVRADVGYCCSTHWR